MIIEIDTEPLESIYRDREEWEFFIYDCLFKDDSVFLVLNEIGDELGPVWVVSIKHPDYPRVYLNRKEKSHE
jgi:hypothetical protein